MALGNYNRPPGSGDNGLPIISPKEVERVTGMLPELGMGYGPGTVPSDVPITGTWCFDAKESNPKDEIGSKKLPLGLVPDTMQVYAAIAFLEGALKYGKFNWRIAGVRFSIYLDAIERHLAKVRNGEWEDIDTGVPHLASVLACVAIILDADLVGKLTDDRPPRAPMRGLIDSQLDRVARLKDVFKNHSPHQYTIDDSQEITNGRV